MNLRPSLLDEVIGQHDVKKQLKISIEASKITGKVYPHALISGPFGLGKTTLAEAIANELGQPIEVINGSNLRNLKNLLPCLARIRPASIIFCDEIHKASPLVQTYLLTVLEQFRYTLGSDKQALTMELPEFCFIGATTNVGPLLPPLVNRFTYHYKLKPYTLQELGQIIRVNGVKIGLDISENCAIMVAATCRGTPRTSVNRLRWLHDYITANRINIINPNVIKESLDLAGIGPDGMEVDDKKYLEKLRNLQPAGLGTLASALNIDKDTIEKVIEPFLIHRGLIKKTQKGRVLCGNIV